MVRAMGPSAGRQGYRKNSVVWLRRRRRIGELGAGDGDEAAVGQRLDDVRGDAFGQADREHPLDGRPQRLVCLSQTARFTAGRDVTLEQDSEGVARALDATGRLESRQW